MGPKDLASFAVYVAMRWPLPMLLCHASTWALWTNPAFGATCPGVFQGPYKIALRGIGVEMDWDVVAVHRWYVLFQLVARLGTRLCDAATLRATPATVERKALVFGGASLGFGALAVTAPYTMMRDCNLNVIFANDASLVGAVSRFVGTHVFWGGVFAWPGLFSMLSVYFATYAAAPLAKRWLLRRTRVKRETVVPCPPCPNAAKRRSAYSGLLFALYLGLCCLWTSKHPVHDAMFFGSYKLKWGLGNPPVTSPMPYHLRTAARPVHNKPAVSGRLVLLRFLAEVGVNALLSCVMFASAALGSTRLSLLGSTTLGAYVVHPYVLGDAVAYLRALKAASSCSGRLADLAQMLVMLGLPALFMVVVGPLSNAILLAPLRYGANKICKSALGKHPADDDVDDDDDDRDDDRAPRHAANRRRPRSKDDALHLL